MMNPSPETVASSIASSGARRRAADGAATQRLLRFEPPMTWQRRAQMALGRQEWLPSALYVLLDAVVWLGVYGAAALLRADAAFVNEASLWRIAALGGVIIVLTLFVVGGHDRRTDMSSLGYMSEHLIALFVAAGLVSLLIYTVAAFDQSMRPSRGVLLASFLAFAPLSLCYRRLIHRALAVNTAKKAFLVLGVGEAAQRFYRAYLQSRTHQRLRFVDPQGHRAGQLFDGTGSPVIEGNLLDQLSSINQEGSSGVIVTEDVRSLSPELLDRLVRLRFERIPVYTLDSFYETHWRRVSVHALDPAWPFQTGFQLVCDSPYAHLKRLFDIFLSGFALALLSPVFLLLGAMVWLDSGRPMLFRQVRVGRGHRLFNILKFRTMCPQSTDTAANPKESELYTVRGDARITRVGGALRKLRLDELPQLWNVLLGDMSLIGPRAEWVKLAERYESEIPNYGLRHLVKPGITGWAQVNYPYGACLEDAIQKLKYDLYYIRHYSLKLDAMITLKTLHVMLFGKGQ